MVVAAGAFEADRFWSFFQPPEKFWDTRLRRPRGEQNTSKQLLNITTNLQQEIDAGQEVPNHCS
jgi:hypothetical protein